MQSDRSSRWILPALIFFLAAILRVALSGQQLWLDEIWSVQIATTMHSVLQVFTLHHEINHHLNTVWLFLIGAAGSAFQYHLLSLVAGTVSVAVAGLIGARRNAVTACLAMFAVGISYQMVLASTEARGYGTLVLASLLAYYLLESQLRRPRWPTATAYAVVTAFGLLSQPVFAAFIAAGVVWSLAAMIRNGRVTARSAAQALAAHVVPVLSCAALYFGDLRRVVAGGGTAAASIPAVWATSLAWALGAPQVAALQFVGGALALVAIAAALHWQWQRDRAEAVFFGAIILVFPLALIGVRGSDLVYVRHFMVATTLLLVLLSFWVGTWWQAGQSGRIACAVAVTGYAAGNAWSIAQLARFGRGEYRQALQFMVDAAHGRPATVGGDQDFRVGTVARYYLAREKPSPALTYLDQSAWPAGGTDWLIVQSESTEPPFPSLTSIADDLGDRFDLVRTFPTAPLSGLHWFVYRNHAAR
ncbi:MAG TPA: hypothetical protein VHW65_12970 [Gemmatimonadales bacterium]|nr:hypothetical protein [Gemmatimonadales bacterium]